MREAAVPRSQSCLSRSRRRALPQLETAASPRSRRHRRTRPTSSTRTTSSSASRPRSSFSSSRLLVVFIVKYRSRGRSRAVEGAQVHGHTRLELIWTAVPGRDPRDHRRLRLLRAPEHHARVRPRAQPDPHHRRGPSVLLAVRLPEPDRARSIGTLHVPAGAVVDLKVVSPDVIHSWWIPALGGKIQAIPGRNNHTWFKATARQLRRPVRRALRRLPRRDARDRRRPTSQQAYQHYLATLARDDRQAELERRLRDVPREPRARAATGRRSPTTRSSIQPAGLDVDRPRRRQRLAGRDAARRRHLDDRPELDALAAYVKKHIYKAAPAGATSGG